MQEDEYVGTLGIAELKFSHGVSAGTYKETETSRVTTNETRLIVVLCEIWTICVHLRTHFTF